MSPEKKRSTAFDNLQAAQDEAADTRSRHDIARDEFATELEEADGKLVTFKARPSGHVLMRTDQDGDTHGTMVPCYSLLDSDREPRVYEGVAIVGLSDSRSHIAVRYSSWGEDYELIPLDSITDFEWVETEAASN